MLGDTHKQILLMVLNICFNLQLIPQEWRKLMVFLIYKKGDRTNIQNYRPISLMPVCRRIYENMILPSITKRVDKYLTEEQGGFRPIRGCTDKLAELNEYIKRSERIIVVSLDQQTAYDYVVGRVL